MPLDEAPAPAGGKHKGPKKKFSIKRITVKRDVGVMLVGAFIGIVGSTVAPLWIASLNN